MNDYSSQNSLLETAWRRFAVLDANAETVQKQYMRMRRLMAFLGVLAVLFAILVDNFTGQVSDMVGVILRVLLILTPILISVIAAFSNRFQQGQKYLSYRAAAEGILKEIYMYRTANQKAPNRDTLLSNRLAAIQRDLFRGAGGELVLAQYNGDVPPYYYPDDERSDPGFTDLTGEEYLVYRLEDQLNWHTKKNLEMQRDRKRIQGLILAFGGIGAFLAAWGGELAVWVAFTASIASALIGWEELRGLDMRVGNYSQVILELNIIRDWWLTLRKTGATDEDTAQLAIKTEKVLYDQNLEWVSAMRKALAEAEGDEAELVEHVIEEGREATAQIQEKLFTEAEELFDEGFDEVVEQVETVIDDAADSLRDMFVGITAIEEDELDLPPDESFDVLETVEAGAQVAFGETAIVEDDLDIPPEETIDTFETTEAVVDTAGDDDFYAPEPEPMTVESAVDAALVESQALAETMVTDEVDFYEPEPEPMTVESAVDAAIAESSLFSSTSEEGFSDDLAEDSLEAEQFVVDESGEELGEDMGEDFADEDFSEDDSGEDMGDDFDDEDFSDDVSSEDMGDDFDDEDFGEDDEYDEEGEFVDEDFGEDQDDEFDDETDFDEEIWDDEI